MRLASVLVVSLAGGAFGMCPPPSRSIGQAAESEVIFFGRVRQATPKSDQHLLKSIREALSPDRRAQEKANGGDLAFTDAEIRAGAKRLGVRGTNQDGEFQPIQVTQFEIIEAFRGINGHHVTLHAEMEPHAGYVFAEGKSYLVFAFPDESTGKLTTSGCNRTHEAGTNDSDLRVIRTMFGEKHRGRLYGWVSADQAMYAFEFDHVPKPVAGVRILVTSDSLALERTTGAEGTFDFSFVPEGTYSISATFRGQPLGPPREITVKSQSWLAVPYYAPE
ncbi:MAG: carboxypeptidase-like regulatory domain-containing protein [Acidobacteriota bacterium]